MLRRSLCALALAVSLAVPALPAAAQAEGDFFKGKTVTVLIGFGVGGGNDGWSRSLAAHLGKHLPGKPAVVPQNMPGAGGLKMTNFLYNAAPRTGLLFGLTSAGVPLEPLLGGKGINFDPLKMNWIGSPDRDTVVCLARKDSTVKTMDDLMTTELVVGATGSGANTNIYPTFFSKMLGMKFKIIRGYKGTRDIVLAAERGEVMGMCASHDPITQQAMYREGKLRILFQAPLVADKDIAAPTTAKFIRSEAQRQAMEVFLAREQLGRPYVAPPGVPADRIQLLRRGFDATMKDPAFVKDAKKQKLNVSPMTGEQLEAVLVRIFKTPKDIAAMTAKALGR